MKEWLNAKTYEYKQAACAPCGDDWIGVPKGVQLLSTDGDGNGLIFWKDDFNLVIGLDDHWDKVCQSFSSFYSEYPRCKILWQRPTQPEPLPFIDDEPQSINDQYAEIEKVRQSGLKFDNGKPRHSLLPKGSISSIIAVLEFGAKKYEANNWQKVDNAKERYYDAAMRHIDSWWNGEKFDQETGIHHLAHAATNLFFLKWFDDKEGNNE